MCHESLIKCYIYYFIASKDCGHNGKKSWPHWWDHARPWPHWSPTQGLIECHLALKMDNSSAAVAQNFRCSDQNFLTYSHE